MDCDKPLNWNLDTSLSNFDLSSKDTVVGANAYHGHARCIAQPWLINLPEDSVVYQAPEEVDGNESECSGVENAMWFTLTERKDWGRK